MMECVSFKLDGGCITAWHAYHHKNVDYMIISNIAVKESMGSLVLGTGEVQTEPPNLSFTCVNCKLFSTNYTHTYTHTHGELTNWSL